MKIVKLYDFQREGVKKIQEFDGRVILADALGLGKTIQSLYWAWKFLPDDPLGPVVVVCPSHLKLHWFREADKHLGLNVEILSGQRVPSDKLPPYDKNQIFVINYDILSPPHWKAGTRPPDDSWVAWLAALRPRLLICDETHRLKSSSAACTRACRKLARIAPHVLLLTGTPLTNKPTDLWSLLNIVHPTLFPSQHSFAMEYTHAFRRWYGWEFKGARNLDRLHSILVRTCMVRRRKCDVLTQLPDIQNVTIPIEVDLQEYRKAESDFLGWLTDKAPTLAQNAAKAMELTKLNYLRQLAGQLKVDAIIKWALDFLEQTDGKLLLGAVHYDVTGPLMKAFGKTAAVLVDGRMDHKKKTAATDRFNHDPRTRIMVGNLQACGSGWSCAVSSDPTLCEIPWTMTDVDQFVARCHGIGRGIPGTNTTARFLVAVGTLEEDMLRILQTKSDWANAAIDGGTGPGFDMLSLLKQSMKNRSESLK